MRFRREAVHLLRRGELAAWIIDKPPALLSHAVENPRPLEPAFTRSAREVVQGRGAGTQSNPIVRKVMEKSAKAQAGQVFAGIDVSAHELSVGMRRGIEDRPTVTTFTNSAAGHKANLVFLQGKARVRVCVEASGNYSLDLALMLQAQRQVEISVVNPRRAPLCRIAGGASKTDWVDARVLCEYVARMPWVPWQPAVRLRPEPPPTAITKAAAENRFALNVSWLRPIIYRGK